MRWAIHQTHSFIAGGRKLAASCAWLLFAMIAIPCAVAEGREPPYDAVIGSDEAFVRSGPDEETYYPTSKLEKGARVKVMREDFGGWLLIEPPAGSHSWIPQQFVERRANNRGVVTARTFDRIGTEIPQPLLNTRHVIQKGETVEILGEEDQATEQGSEKMFKIRPPRGEFRYLNKRDIVAADEAVDDVFAAPKSVDGDVFAEAKKGDDPAPAKTKNIKKAPALPANAEEGVATPHVEGSKTEERPAPATVKTDDVEVMEQLPPGTINAYERLAQVDRDFKAMVAQPVDAWQLEAIRGQYTELKDSPQLADAGFQREVNRRLASVTRYEKNYADYVDLVQIMKQTEARDEQLRQQFLATREVVSTSMTPTTRVYRDVSKPAQQPLPTTTAEQPRWTTPTQPQPQPQQPHVAQPQAAPGQWQRSGTPTPGLPGAPLNAGIGAPRRFDGAGIIQRSALNRPDMPRHVLVAPNGRVLTYLQAGQGIDLDRHLGQSMGFFGQRGFRQELNADLLVINSMQPVQLRQP